MNAILVILQALATILLSSIGYFSVFRTERGDLKKVGRILLFVAATALVIAMGATQFLNELSTRRSQVRIEYLIHTLYSAMAKEVMTTPGGRELPVTTPADEAIKILEPHDGSKVNQREVVCGKVGDSSKPLWLIVHPMETSSYWVQPAVVIRPSGKWCVSAYFGRSGDIDIGKYFEIVAIREPNVELREGQNFDRWPDAQTASQAIVVQRH